MAANQQPSILIKTAIDNGRVDVLRSLLAEIRAKDYHDIVDAVCVNGGTFLHYVTEKNDLDALRTLLSSGANPCVQNDDGKTSYASAKTDDVRGVFVQELLQAVGQSKLGRICQLLAAGVPIESVDGFATRNSVLHWAASFGNEGVIRVLCEGGCNLCVKNAKGDTPLHDAVRRGDSSIVKKLLWYGADPSIKNVAKEDCYDLASKKPELLQCLSIHNVAERVQRSNSLDSTESQHSMMSTTSLLPSPTQFDSACNGNGAGRMFAFKDVGDKKWHEFLWPRPHYLSTSVDADAVFALPDRKLRVFPLAGSETTGADLAQALTLFAAPTLADMKIGLEIEYEVQKCNAERVSGLTCGVFPSRFLQENAYQLRIVDGGVELMAKDRIGLAYGLTTFVQCLRLASYNKADVSLPKMCIRDWPDTKYRSVLVDFTGCRVFTVDTLCKMALNMVQIKGNQMIVHFEVRIQDPFTLPYNQNEIYYLRQFCESRYVDLVPSLDLNCEEVDAKLALDIVAKFIERFTGVTTLHFGSNLSRFLMRNVDVLSAFVPWRVKHAFLSLKDAGDLSVASHLPPQCTLTVPPLTQFTDERLMDLCNISNSICIRFGNCDAGYLCQAPEEMVKNAILAAQLGDKCQALSVMACDYVSGCEIVPRSFSFLPELAVLGAAWNRDTDMKHYFFVLPNLVAEHVCGDRKMTPLFQEILVMGHLERELTKMMSFKYSNTNNHRKGSSSQQVRTLSVFVQLLLNPDFIDLELLTPVAFKKVRIELQKCLQSLNNLKRELPYNYELALSVAEVQLMCELMILASKIGQSLCLVGTNPRQNMGVQIINVGVANLLLTSRTDLANKLLEIRTQFQHAWLSRNLPGTLANALKIFDNLFKTLLPPALQQFGENLL